MLLDAKVNVIIAKVKIIGWLRSKHWISSVKSLDSQGQEKWITMFKVITAMDKYNG